MLKRILVLIWKFIIQLLRLLFGIKRKKWSLNGVIDVTAERYVLKISYKVEKSREEDVNIDIEDTAEEEPIWREVIEKESGEFVIPVALWGIRDGKEYNISITTADGKAHAASPKIIVAVPAYPGVE